MLGRTPFYDDGNGQAKMKMPAPKSERLQGKEKKEKGKWESDKKAIAREPPSAAAIFHYTALKLRRQSSIFSHPRIAAPPTPPKQLLLPSFLLCFAMGKMSHSTYQLNAYTSEWGGGHVGMHILYM